MAVPASSAPPDIQEPHAVPVQLDSMPALPFPSTARAVPLLFPIAGSANWPPPASSAPPDTQEIYAPLAPLDFTTAELPKT
jgi:hypothetical protein